MNSAIQVENLKKILVYVYKVSSCNSSKKEDKMIKAVIYALYETLINHYNTPLYFGKQMAEDMGISEENGST